MSKATLWERVKTGGKTGFDKTWAAVDKLGAPVNRLTNKIGSEAFWPTTLDKESDKAARILKSFCKDGFYTEEERRPDDGPTQKQRVIQKIPESVIKNAKGLAIFTTMRTGLWFSGAGGSGILIGRTPDGSWSPPSGIMLHTAGLGFLVGIDIYDCVVVINTQEALNAFTKVRCTLGGEISAVAGPVGVGGVLETEVHKRQSPIYTYMKSRGFYAGVQIDGTVVIERTDENERFYSQRIGVNDIMAGKVRYPPKEELRRLFETVKAAQGDSNIDESLIPNEPPPGDYEIENGQLFGIPDKEDPDPYGVLALEKEGLGVVEAGTKKRASWEEFSFSPSPSSPVHNMFARGSQETNRRNSWRTSAMSNLTQHGGQPGSLRNSGDTHHPAYANSCTQTDLDDSNWPPSPGKRSYHSGISRKGSHNSVTSNVRTPLPEAVPEGAVLSPAKSSTPQSPNHNGLNTPPHTPPIPEEPKADADTNTDIQIPTTGESLASIRASLDLNDDNDDDHHDEPIVQNVQTVQSMRPTTAQRLQKATIVSVPKRGPPPALPPRNPNRMVVDASPIESIDEAGPAADLMGSDVDGPKHDSGVAARVSLLNEKEDPVESQKAQRIAGNDQTTDVSRQDPPSVNMDQAHNKRESTASDGSGSRMPGGFE